LILLYVLTLALVAVSIVSRHWLRIPAGSPEMIFYIPVGLLATVYLVLPAVLVALSFWEQRVGRSIAEAIVVFGAAATAVLAGLGPHDGALKPSQALLFSTSYVAIRLPGLVVVRTFFKAIVVHDGSLCELCGYNLKCVLSGICPECGQPLAGSS